MFRQLGMCLVVVAPLYKVNDGAGCMIHTIVSLT